MIQPLTEDAAPRVRGFFRDCRFDKEGLTELGFGEEMPARNLRNRHRLLELTGEPTARNLIARLFRLGVAEDLARVRQLLPSWFVEDCAACGLLQQSEAGLASPVMLTPFEDLLVANDHARVLEGGGQPDAVLIVNPTTWLLHRFAVRGESPSTLELCAGNGAIGLGAAAWSDRVVLTDLSARAMEFAAFSASLNGVRNAECLVGDGFEPVAGRRFDRILANPPFYVTPNMRFLYVNNDLGLDQFCSRLAHAAAEYLNEGGYYQMLCEWVEVEGAGWEDRVRGWVDGTGCDAWIIKGSTTKTPKYAQDRIREMYPFDWDGDGPRFAEWMDYYRQHRVVAIHRGLVAMRKRSGSNWVHVDDCPTTPGVPFGDGIARGFETFDFLATNPSDDAILHGRFRVVDGVKLTQRLSFANGKFQPEALELTASLAVPSAQKIEPLVAGFLDQLDGTRTLAEMTGKIAARAGAPMEKVQAECVGVVRRLLARGFLQRETVRAA